MHGAIAEARECGTGIANSNECNTADGRLSSCPKGAIPIHQLGVGYMDVGQEREQGAASFAALGKDTSFPADCALT